MFIKVHQYFSEFTKQIRVSNASSTRKPRLLLLFIHSFLSLWCLTYIETMCFFQNPVCETILQMQWWKFFCSTHTQRLSPVLILLIKQLSLFGLLCPPGSNIALWLNHLTNEWLHDKCLMSRSLKSVSWSRMFRFCL